MFEKIMIISEPLPNFDTALKTVGNLKKLGTRESLLVQCIGMDELNETISTFIKSVYEENLEAQRQVLVEQGLAVTVRETFGFLKDDINRIAEEEGCSLIVAGDSKRTMLGAYLFGGAAMQIMHESHHPLLLVRLSADADQYSANDLSQDVTSHILFPTDFSDNADQAFVYLQEMVSHGIKKVTLMHIQDKSRIDPRVLNKIEEYNAIDRARLQKMADVLHDQAELDISLHLTYGSPTAEILKVIKEENVSLTVMGSQGRGFINEIYLGSVSHNIARHSSASVLLIPAAR